MSKTTQRLIKEFTEGDDLRDRGQRTPEYAERFDDIVYGTDPVHQVLDVYRPKGAAGKLPVIVSVHGGGWFYGDKERYQWYCLSLTQYGFAVINFTYRLMPEFTFPAPLEDTDLVMKWMVRHAEDYGFDTDNVFMVGDSAGGQLAGSYAAILTNRTYAEAFPFDAGGGFTLRAVALNCGIYTKEAIFGGDAPELMDEYIPGYTEKEMHLMDVTEQITPDYPPVYVMSAADDYLLPQAPVMADALLKNRVPFLMRVWSDPVQPLTHVFHVDMRLKQAAEANRDQCRFFLDHCKAGG